MPHISGGRFRTSRCSATVQSRDAFQALLSPSALGAVLQRGGDPCGRPGGGSAALPTSSLTQSGSRCLLRSPCWWVCSLRSHCRSLAMWNRDPCGRPGDEMCQGESGDPCGRPDHALHCWRPFSHVQVFSHCAEQRCLPSSALAIRSLCSFAEM